MSLTLSGAYGRDYKSKADVTTAWNAGADFLIRGLGSGYVNRSDLEKTSDTYVTIRYAKDRKLCVLYRRADGWKAA